VAVTGAAGKLGRRVVAELAAAGAAAACGIRNVVMASSASAYGMTFAPEPFSPAFVPIDEDHPLLTRPVPGTASPWSTERARRLLGFEPSWSWRQS
jgi:nucleoside-diphosphate-sugar epimerase